MNTSTGTALRLAIIGGGPASVYLLNELVKRAPKGTIVDIYEEDDRIGPGMPYGKKGAESQHLSNVSSNEIPKLDTSMTEWIKQTPTEKLAARHFDKEKFDPSKVLPRLLLGDYLTSQFELLKKKAKAKQIMVNSHLGTRTADIRIKDENNILVKAKDLTEIFNYAFICTGHYWPKKYERSVTGYFDDPYPPSKLSNIYDHPIAIRGSSLTAIDAIRTLAETHGNFQADEDGRLEYHSNYENFKIVMHSLKGLMPSLRFHQEDLQKPAREILLSESEIEENKKQNAGFVKLDYVFEKTFKDPLREKDPGLYHEIKDLQLESFVDWVMSLREKAEPFALFKAEYLEGKKSLRRKESIHWKELLTELSFAMNYPAKHFSAEDILRLKNKLMPLISIIIAFVPQESAGLMIALHEAGRLELISVNDDSEVTPQDDGGIIYSYGSNDGKEAEVRFQTFIDCTGQPPLSIDDLPFKSLVDEEIVSQAYLKFHDPDIAKSEMNRGKETVQQTSGEDYYLKVPGLSINDHLQVLDKYGKAQTNLYIMAVPFIAGLNPDYSGLDFCKEASQRIAKSLFPE